MTTQDFENLKYSSKELLDLNRRIRKHEDEINEMRAKVEKTTSQITGMPHGSNGQNDAIAILIDLKTIYEREVIDVQYRIAQMERIISQIPDLFVRLICRYKYIDNKSWSQTAMAIGGGNTADSCRMAVKRYLNKERMVKTNAKQ